MQVRSKGDFECRLSSVPSLIAASADRALRSVSKLDIRADDDVLVLFRSNSTLGASG